MSGRTASGGTLSLGADGNSTLAVTDAATFAMTASNTDYQIVNRRNGAVVMLCDPLPAGGNPGGTLARYVAFATNSATADTQGTPVTNAAELAGKSFYEINECSYVNDDLSSQQQSSDCRGPPHRQAQPRDRPSATATGAGAIAIPFLGLIIEVQKKVSSLLALHTADDSDGES